MQSMIHVEQRAWIIEVSVSEVPSTVFVLVQYPVSSLAFTHVFFLVCFCFVFLLMRLPLPLSFSFISCRTQTEWMGV